MIIRFTKPFWADMDSFPCHEELGIEYHSSVDGIEDQAVAFTYKVVDKQLFALSVIKYKIEFEELKNISFFQALDGCNMENFFDYLNDAHNKAIEHIKYMIDVDGEEKQKY
jgi:hypothetical protein